MCPVFPVAFPCLVLSELLLIQLCCVGSCTVLESSGVMESLMTIPALHVAWEGCERKGNDTCCVWVQRWDRLVSHPRSFGSKYVFSKRKVNWGLGSAVYSKITAPSTPLISVSLLLSRSC